MKKVSLYVAIAIVVMALLPSIALAESLGITAPCYPVLSPTNNTGEMAVTWWDAPTVTSASVQYGLDAELSGDVATASATLTQNDTSNGYSAFEAVMTGLAEETSYYYRVGNSGNWSPIYHFKPGDSSTDQVSFLYMGDIQYSSYPNAVTDYANWGSLLSDTAANFPDLDFALLGGDMVQQGQAPGNWQWFFANASPVYSELPLLAVPGNHESNADYSRPELFLKLFDLPKNGPSGFKEEFYSYDYGNCHIVGLDSSVYLDSSLIDDDYAAIADWITADLAASDQTWKIVVLHHPPYAVVSDDVSAKVLAAWGPLFYQAQVDLILCGHQHVYMRTKPIKGVTEVMGNSGSQFYAPANVSYSDYMLGYTSNYEIITTTTDQLTLTAYDASGNSFDSVILAAKDRSVPPDYEDDAPGDINGDGSLTSADVTLLLVAIQTNAAYSETADVNGDGKIDIRDAHALALACE